MIAQYSQSVYVLPPVHSRDDSLYLSEQSNLLAETVWNLISNEQISIKYTSIQLFKRNR